MSTTVSVDATTVAITGDLYWEDEFSWAPVEQSVERTITGALVVQVSTRQAGRPMTLSPYDKDSAWITRASLDQLKTWAGNPGQTMVLTYRGQTYNVVFRHHDGEVIRAEPVKHMADVQSDDWYTATLRFMEI